MTEIRIYCDQGHPRWNIATMTKIGDQDVWDEKQQYSDARRRNNHGKIKPPTGKLGKNQTPEEYVESIKQNYDAAHGVNYRLIHDDVEVWSEQSGVTASPPNDFDWAPGPDGQTGHHVTFTFKCEHCVNRRRHSTVTRRATNLDPVLDLIAGAGLTEISVDQLARGIGEYDRARRS